MESNNLSTKALIGILTVLVGTAKTIVDLVESDQKKDTKKSNYQRR